MKSLRLFRSLSPQLLALSLAVAATAATPIKDLTASGNTTVTGTIILPSATTFSSASATREALEVAYPAASLAVSGKIAVWGNSMGATGSSTPWPYWLAIRTGRSVYNGSVAGENSSQIKIRFDAASDKRGYFTIFDVARNDSDFTVTKSNLAAMIASLGHTRYLVIGVLCRRSTPTGNAQHTLDLALNADLLALYGTRFYNPQDYLVGLWDPSAAQDVTDHGNDVFPQSLEYNSDSTHLNIGGHLAQVDRIAPLVLHALGEFTPSFAANARITKSAPTLYFANTGAGGKTFRLSTTAAAGDFRITEDGVADYVTILPTTGYVGIGTTTPVAPFVVSNGGQLGLEINPTISSGTQINLLAYNRVAGTYGAVAAAAASWAFTGAISFSDQFTLTSTTAGYIAGTEQSSSPAAPAADGWRIYAKDNGAGKTVLYVRFATGAEQQIAIQP